MALELMPCASSQLLDPTVVAELSQSPRGGLLVVAARAWLTAYNACMWLGFGAQIAQRRADAAWDRERRIAVAEMAHGVG